MPLITNLDGVRVSDDDFPVQLWMDDETGRLVIRAFNEGGFACVDIDLFDLERWFRSNAEKITPGITTLLSATGKFKVVPVEPTQEMCEAAPSMPPIHATDDLHLAKAGWSMKAISNLKRYTAMLKAAP